MKIIQLLNPFRYGGSERVAQAYQVTLKELGYEVITCATAHHLRTSVEGVKLFNNRLNLFGYVIRFVFAESGPILLFCHSTGTLIIGGIIRLMFFKRVKIVYIRHFQYTRSIIGLLTFCRILVDKVILITPTEETKAKRLFGSRLIYINNYINYENGESQSIGEIKAWARGRKILAFAGTMKQGKHPQHLLQLALGLGSTEYCYLFIGDGPEGAKVKQFFEQHKQTLGDAVLFVGFQEDVISILKQVDYLFFCSWNNYEMMPMVLLEAMSARCVCLAYRMEINKALLPAENLFAFEDFQQIIMAVQKGQCRVVPNPFDADYGKRKILELMAGWSDIYKSVEALKR